MQSLGGAVIHMLTNSNDIEFLVGDMTVLKKMQSVPVLPMFSQQAVDFLAALSQALFKDERTKRNTDIMSYAYWIRRSSIENIKKKHKDYKNRLGRGVAFHIAPSNVPVNFAVSMTSSVLAGNATLIKLSNKQFEQVDIIVEIMNDLLNHEFLFMRPYFCLIRYNHSDEITQELSDICDVRIVWGGNGTVDAIRKAILPPRAVEMTFADRHSLAIINADVYLKSNPEEVAKWFYTDTYYTDQNACSSPRLIVWMGKQIEKAKLLFWDHLNKIVIKKYEMKPIQAVDKYASACMLAMKQSGVRFNFDNNYVMRVEVNRLTKDLMKYKNGGGFFFEYDATDISDILPILDKQCQTISVLGIDKKVVKDLIFSSGVKGGDRIVQMGQTMGLEFIWDGYKMIEQMTRFVYTGEYE